MTRGTTQSVAFATDPPGASCTIANAGNAESKIGEGSMRLLPWLAGVALVLLTTGCATLTKGTQQTITVATDPPGAACTMSRDAKAVAVVNPTPGSMPIEKGAGTISILCKKQGYQDAAGVLASEFQAMTFGNILFGGVVGIVVDAASGAMHRYPDRVTITLIPAEFTTVKARDEFFDRMRATLEREAAEVKERIDKACTRGDCDQQLAAAEAGRTEKLAEIEQRRASAAIVGQ
jgi:hypothetical protein